MLLRPMPSPKGTNRAGLFIPATPASARPGIFSLIEIWLLADSSMAKRVRCY